MPTARYREWFASLPADLREAMEEQWGPAPGNLYVDNGDVMTSAGTAAARIARISC